VQAEYRRIAAAEPERVAVVDADRPLAEVQARIEGLLTDRIINVK
jgi:thymidylate kinase